MQNKSDIELIEAIREGDHDLYRIIVNRYQQQVARTVIGMMGHGDEADDVGQEVFIRFYKSLDKFRGDSALSTYLTRIAINLSLNALNKKKRSRIFKLFSHNDEDGQQADKLENIANYDNEHEARDTQELVQLALSRLDVKFRSIIVLRMLEGFTTKETAETLNIPLGTVLSRLARAQEKLKQELKQLGYENAE